MTAMSLLPNKTIGQRIRIAREYLSSERQRHISQAELAELCGWGQTRIGNYERDIRTPDAEAVAKIAEVTGCRAEWIQFSTGTMHAYQEGLQAGIELERNSQSGGTALTQRHQVLIHLFDGLTPDQQDAVLRDLEDTQRRNAEIFEALSRQRKTG